MDYRRYYEKLRIKNEEKKDMFPQRYLFSHSGNKNYSNAMSSNSYGYNFVISSNRSSTYGNNFQGLIVELYISQDNHDSYFNQLLQFKEKIEEELNIESIVWQPSSETPSKNVCRIYAKKSVDIDNESRWDEYAEWQVNTMINFLKVFPKYTERLNEMGSVIMSGSEEEFRKKYKSFVETLPLQNSGEYAKLYTGSQNKPFKVNKNSSGSIVVRAFTEQSSPMVISANQLSKVLFNNDRYLYSSYEPILINRIDNELMINGDEVVEDIIDPNPLPSPEMNKIKNIILYGSPGVGKTHNTKKLINLIESGKSEKELFETIKNNELNDVVDIANIKDRVKFITFHQSFGYEDFIEGFRPNKEGSIELQDGIFKTICNDANNDKEKNYYLVIDEINRGNISKIFGELITLIEEDKRDTLEVTLPYSKKPFKIPFNLFIIGTMNSTDKSIALIDIALRRRFTFLKMEPNLDLVDNVKAKNIMKQLNEKITETLGKDYVLGHSYFMKIENDDDLEFVLEYKVKPLLEEYFYGDEQGYQSIIKIIENHEVDDNA